MRNGTVLAEELSEIFRSVSDELQEKSVLSFVQGFCFATFFRNHSLYIFDSHSQNSVGFQTTSGASVFRNKMSGIPVKKHGKKPQGFLKEAGINSCEITRK